MPAVDTPAICCDACKRKFAWKAELAGKRVKCKCGATIAVPAPKPAAVKLRPKVPSALPNPKPPAVVAPDGAELDGLFALADDAERAAAAMPIEVMDFAPEPVVPIEKPIRQAVPLGYQRGPTARERERALAAAAALVDPVRDLYAPLAILVVGFGLHLGYYIFRFHLGSAAVVPVGIGVVILTVIKAALLVGFALVMASPLGVSFGGLWSAILKLAAIAVFTDGTIAWVDLGLVKISGGFGGSGIFGWGIVGFPVAMGMYWGLLIYLFSMDPGDSWMVVILLSVFDRIMRWVVLLLLLATVLSWGGISMPASPGATRARVAKSSSVHNSLLSTEVDELKAADALEEGNKFIAEGHQSALQQTIKDWYSAGAVNVWFAMTSRDINGRRSPLAIIVELPDAKSQRTKCYDVLRQYYKDQQLFSLPSDFQDTGETYLEARLRF